VFGRHPSPPCRPIEDIAAGTYAVQLRVARTRTNRVGIFGSASDPSTVVNAIDPLGYERELGRLG
jgi:hypothetical protein